MDIKQITAVVETILKGMGCKNPIASEPSPICDDTREVHILTAEGTAAYANLEVILRKLDELHLMEHGADRAIEFLDGVLYHDDIIDLPDESYLSKLGHAFLGRLTIPEHMTEKEAAEVIMAQWAEGVDQQWL